MIRRSRRINAEPFEAAGQMYEKLQLPPIPKNDKGFMDKEPFLIPSGFEDENSTPAHIMLRADAADYMSFTKKLGGMARFGDFSNSFTKWMSRKNFGLYVSRRIIISDSSLLIFS